MSKTLKIYMVQMNPTVGAARANGEKIAAAYARAMVAGADLVLTPELSVIGYPPEDLVLKPAMQAECRNVVESLAALTEDDGAPGLIVGAPWRDGDALYNASILIDQGQVSAVRYKHDLPNYGVFDEKRVFKTAPPPKTMEFRGHRLGVMICEDMWFADSAASLKADGADILLVPTCSPYESDKHGERLAIASQRVTETKLPLVFTNQICGQDELAFDGASFVVDGTGEKSVQMSAWCEEELLVEIAEGACITPSFAVESTGLDAVYQAMVLSVRDYVNKNRFPGVLIGMSGGVDSALSAAVAVDALGADRVKLVMMPSKFTSAESHSDAEQAAKYLGAHYDVIAIEEGVKAFDHMLAPQFAGLEADTTEENIQSRLRGLILMSLSNKFGYMVLTTGNKSEMSVGYATLYGDMCGGYNPLKDVYKTTVFDLCRWRNSNRPAGCLGPDGLVMPDTIITKPPTAELRADQKDEDSLPPYDQLDGILRGLVDDEKSAEDLVKEGFDASEVARIEHLLYIAEYKRRQAPPGVKITRKNYGRDRRYPITNGYRSARRENNKK